MTTPRDSRILIPTGRYDKGYRLRTKDLDSPTRTKLLDAAQELMLAKGFVATTVDAICAAAGVTKGSFFHYFQSKEELGKVLLERFARTQEAAFAGACGQEEDPLERVYALIDVAIVGSAETKGCLVGTFAQEISETHPELRAVCQTAFERVAASVARDLVEAKRIHAPEVDFDAGSLGDCFLALAQGSMLVLKTSGNRESMAKNLMHFRGYLKSLYGK